MPELSTVSAAIGAGALCAGSVWLAAHEPAPAGFAWLNRRTTEIGALLRSAVARRRWVRDFERAGWRATPERIAVMAIASALCMGALGAAVSATVAALGVVGSCIAFAIALAAGIDRRRRRMAADLVPLLELFTLELSGGGSPLAALGSVCVQVESELAIDLRRMLIASQVAGSASFEARLINYSEQHQVAALSTLATILGAGRDYGTPASPGVRALATDLRRGQRRELIAQSRRALNHVLLPAAVAILLPFLGVLMFPAVSVLQKSLR